MSPELGRAAFRMAMFVAFPSFVLLLFQQPGTAEFVVTVMALVVGLAFMGTIIVLVRRR